MKKLYSILGMFLVFFLVFVSFAQFEVVNAQVTIYIRSDGSIDPSTESIQRNGDTFTVIGDFDYIVVLERNNTIFDGAGHTVGGIYGAPQFEGQSQIDRMNNITVVNAIINGDGIFFLNTDNSVIANNTLNNGRGIDCTGSRNNISNNTINSGRGLGSSGYGNIISGNTLTNCNYTFVENNPRPYGISVGGSNNTLLGNYIVGINGTAINIGKTSFNNIVGNRIANNDVGIYTLYIYTQGGAHDNIIYCNSFINNKDDVQNDVVIVGNSANIWDYRSVGNYWSNYNGNDDDGDGIGDTPYVIDDDNQDNYPLMEPLDTCPNVESVIGRTLKGTISSDTTWTKTNSPYDLVGDIFVSKGATLTIEAGVTINFHRYTIKVNGTLKVQGTPNDKVVFLSGNKAISSSQDLIGGINFGDESSNCVIENAVLETLELTYYNCKSSITLNNNYFKEQSTATASGSIGVLPTIRGPGNATITNNIFTGRIQLMCSATLVNNTFIGGGVDASHGSFIFINNTFAGDQSTGMGYGIGVDTNKQTVISDNYLSNYHEACIRIIHGPALIQRNFIQNTPTKDGYPFFGIAVDGTSPLIQNNTITDCGIGIRISDSGVIKAKPTIRNNNIYDNNFNIYLGYPERPGHNPLEYFADSNITAVNNWWGTTDSQSISETIYDSRYRPDLGTVDFTLFLTAVNPEAAPNAKEPFPTVYDVPASRFIQATRDDGTMFNLVVSGDLIIMWNGKVTVTADQVTALTNVSFVVRKNEPNDFLNVTVPKNEAPYGTTPIIYFDDQQAQDQGYTQDDTNYYVWCTTHFDGYYYGDLTIVLSTTPPPNEIPEPPSNGIPELQLWTILPLFLVAALLIIIYRNRVKQKQHIKRSQSY